MIKKRRTYLPRIVGDKVMMPPDLKRLRPLRAPETPRPSMSLWTRFSLMSARRVPHETLSAMS